MLNDEWTVVQNTLDDVCVFSPLQSVTLDSPPLWDESLSLKAKGLYSVLYLRSTSGVGISYELLSKINGGSMHSMRTAVGELKEAGYLEIERVRGDNGQVGRSVWKLFPYAHGLNGELANMTPSQSKQRWLEQSYKNRGKQIPRSDPETYIQHQGSTNVCKMQETPCQPLNNVCNIRDGENHHNPRSNPDADIQHQELAAPHKTKHNPTSVLSYPVRCIEGQHPCAGDYEYEGLSKEEAQRFLERSYVSFNQLAESKRLGSDHQLENITEEQVERAFGLIEKRCGFYPYREDQYAMCRPLLDELFEGSYEYQRSVMSCIEQVAHNASWEIKKYPSYWIKDYGKAIREKAETMAENWGRFA